MAILAGELKLYKAKVMNDTTANGGLMSNTEIVTGIKNAFLPDVAQSERIAGLDHRYRKFFAKVANDDDIGLVNAVIHFKNHTPGGDRLELFAGDHSNTQANITGSERRYGAGALTTSASIAAASVDVTLEDATQVIFVNADKVYITDGVNEEYHSNVTISKVGDTVTITFDSGDTLQNDYSDTDTFVASVAEFPSIDSSCTDPVIAGGGTLVYDNTLTNEIVVDHIAGVYDTFVLTVGADLNSFTCVGTNTGAMPAGALDTDYTPPNANFSNKPFFTVKATGYTGTPVDGTTITFTTSPAAQGVWVDDIVPAATDSYSGNGADIRFGGESA